MRRRAADRTEPPVSDATGQRSLLTRRQAQAIDRRLEQLDKLAEVALLWVGEAGEVRSLSPLLEEMLGESPDQIWDRLRADLAGAGEALPEPGSVHQVQWQRRGEEKPRPLSVQVLAMPGGGSMLVLIRDRSSIEALENDLATAAQLRNLSRLSLGLAHDLKTPLNSLTLNLELLKRSLAAREKPPADHARQARWIEVLEEQIERLDRALDEVLARTVVVEGVETREFDLRDLLGEVVRLVGVQARQQAVELEVDSPGEAVPVEGHYERLKLALLNVAVNALDAMPQEGRLRLALSIEGEEARLEIEDDGPGIPAEHQERIFDLHFTTHDSGTGIGLYVARLSAELSRGRLDLVRSTPEGTLFALSLPLSTAKGIDGLE